MNEGKHQSQEENQKLQAENADLAKQLREAKESARPVMPEKHHQTNLILLLLKILVFLKRLWGLVLLIH